MIIKDLAKKFEGSFECLGDNREKYITFLASIKKQLDNSKMITCKIRFKNSCRFMSSSLSSLVDNFADINCEKCDNKREYIGFRDNHILLKCFDCIAWFIRDSKKLIKRFANTYEFCNKYINKFILLLRKGVYPYEYMDNWERFDETSLPNEEAFYSSLNIENIIHVDYRHENSVFKDFKMNNLGDYHDLYEKSDTVLLAYVFEKHVHENNSAGVSMASLFKENKSRIRIKEEGIRGGMCHAVHRYAKANN